MKEEKVSFYDKLLKNRVIIMVIIIFIITPLLFCVGLLTVTYTNNKPNLFPDVEYTKTSIEYLNKNKFEVEEYTLTRFALNLEDEYYSDGQIELDVDLGSRIDKNIANDARISIQFGVCYNWVNESSTKSNRTAYVGANSSSVALSITFDATFEKKPFFFKTVDIQKDVRFVTMFSWDEQKDGEATTVYYLVESSFDDLYVSGTTLLQKK